MIEKVFDKISDMIVQALVTDNKKAVSSYRPVFLDGKETGFDLITMSVLVSRERSLSAHLAMETLTKVVMLREGINAEEWEEIVDRCKVKEVEVSDV